ncbi:MAG: DUF2887 domain-containing protein, partial [Candidatus Competibacter sp.]|nr:DUF2887 domain-containing protein [Candidatus Competibacter sp.]
MKTDPSLYEFLATGTEAFRVLTGGLTLPGAYRFISLTLKGIERRLDGIYEPEGHDGPVYVVEFQGQVLPSAWYNLLAKIGLYGEQHPKRDVRGALLFLRKSDDTGTPPVAANAGITVAYLDEVLPAWRAREPDNPFVAVFLPLILRDPEDLLAAVPTAWRAIRTAPLAGPVRATLERMLECWLFERFPALTTEELRTMLSELTPLEQTRAYQEIFAKGKAEGEAKGKAEGEAKGKAEGEAKGKAEGEAKGKIEGKIEDLKLLLARRFGPLPDWAAAR